MKYIFAKTFLKLHFIRIQRNLRCEHSLAESFQILDLAFKCRNLSSALAEFGAFKGGLTSKLSLIAKYFSRKLYVYDSFDGLPDPKIYGTGKQIQDYQRHIENGEKYLGTLEDVRTNIGRYGSLEHCELIKGLFTDSFSLPDIHPSQVSLVVIDVDLTLSFRQCLEFIWDRLEEGGILFCHESRDQEIVNEIKKIGLLKYKNQGVGTGLGPHLQNLCWIRKIKESTF